MTVTVTNEFERRGDYLFWGGCNLSELAGKYGTPLFVFSRQQLEKTYREIESSFRTAGLQTEIFFSFKTNPVPEILKALIRFGAGAEVVSEFELWLARKLGLSGDRIVVNGSVKTPALLREAVLAQVALLNVESVTELQMLVKLAAELDLSVNIGLRINPMLKKRRFDFTVSSGVATSHIGFIPGSSEWESALEILRHESALHLRGLHFHIGSGVTSTKPYAEAFDVALRTWKDLLHQGFSQSVLDIGGGFQIPNLKAFNLFEAVKLFGWNRSPEEESTKSAARESVISATAQLCAKKLDEFSATNGFEPPILYVEPGRAAVASSALLLLTVARLVQRERGQCFAVCDGGAMSISPLLLSENHRILVSNKNGEGPKQRYNLVGNLPTPLDFISLGRELPLLSPGDHIAVMDTGAYFTSLANNFAGPRAAITFIDDGIARLVRRRETYEDLICRDVTSNATADYKNCRTESSVISDPASKEDRDEIRYPTTGNALESTRHLTQEAATRAAVAFQSWSVMPLRSRREYLRNLRRVIVKRQLEIIETVAQETRKPITEVITQEVTAALEMLMSFEKAYPRWLRPSHTRYWRPGFWTKDCAVHYEPLGVFAIIGPTNYPFSLPVLQTAVSLISGNTVVLKPSERCPRTARLLKQLFDEAKIPQNVVEVIEGDGETVAQLIANESITKVIFTGKYSTGRRIAELCGRNFKPCILELGGSAAAVVCEDANLILASKGIAWSAFYANSASCVGTKRVFVQHDIAEKFERLLKKEVERIKQGEPLDPATEIGRDDEIDGDYDVHEILTEALRRGARFWSASENLEPAAWAKVRTPALFFDSSQTPILINSEVDRFDSLPLLVVRSVLSIDQALSEINSSNYALSASVWSRSSNKSKKIARRLNAGIVWINDSSAGQPQFPWGGSKHSGWGRLFAREALVEITNVKVVSHDRRRNSFPKLWWFPYTREKFQTFLAVNDVTYGTHKIKSLPRTVTALYRLVRHFRQQF